MASKWFDKLIEAKILDNLKEISPKVDIRLVDKRVSRVTNVVVVGELTNDQKKVLKEVLPLALDDGAEILEAEYEENSKDYIEKLETGQDPLIKLFQDKIPEEDLYALKASYYIKRSFDEGKDVHSLKRDLRNRYGRRGINISNLYSAGYFSSWIKPLLDSAKNQADFLEAYNYVVEQSPFAVFVHASMSVQDIVKEVLDKINDNKKFGIKSYNIHGIGMDNISKIIKSIEDIKKEIPDIIVENEPISSIFVAKLKLI